MPLDWSSVAGEATDPYAEMLNPSGGVGKSAPKKGKKPSAIQKNRNALSELTGMSPQQLSQFLASDGGTSGGQDPLEAALASAALQVSGIDLFTYGGDQKLPHWVPKELRSYATPPPGTPSPLEGKYDPYYGMLNQQGDERVYMGSQERDVFKDNKHQKTPDLKSGKDAKLYGDSYTQQHKVHKHRDKTVTYQQAMNMPYQWSDQEVSDAMKKFRHAGINVTDFDSLTQAWGSLVDRASKMYTVSLGDRKVSPWDVLELHKREAKKSGTLTDYQNGTQTQTSRSVSDISEGASWQVLQSTLSQLLGRDPSDQEVRDYAYRMNTLAAKNPSITETITRYKGGQAVGSNSHTTGGFDAGDMAHAAYDQAQNDPEYAKVQAGTTYFNALMSGLGAIGDV